MQSIDNKDTVLGRTAKEWLDLLKTTRATDAARSLAYFDGDQEEEVLRVFNDPKRGRKKWAEKGLTPRFRNITRMVVEKSGTLFKDAPPVLEVFLHDAKTPDANATQIIAEHLSRIDFPDFMSTHDQITRLMKTTVTLVQWNKEDKLPTLDLLTRANCAMVIDSQRRVIGLIHRVSDDSCTVWTKESMVDVRDVEGSAVMGEVKPNPYGLVPAVVGYDTATPRTGIWAEQDKSLVGLNEMVNLHISDSEYSSLWMKMSTLFTNMSPEGGNGDNNNLELASPTDPLGRGARRFESGITAGPGEVVQIDSMGVDNPFIDFKAPVIPLQQINDVINVFVQDYAADWSVRIRASGEGSASSGFQLVVEEMANLDLRKQRQRMYTAFFKRFYKVLSRVLNVGSNAGLPEDADLFARFAPPKLPVDQAAQQKLWEDRVNANFATPIDYFMEERDMTKEEAEAKWEEIKAFNEANKPKVLQVPEIDTENDEKQVDNPVDEDLDEQADK